MRSRNDCAVIAEEIHTVVTESIKSVFILFSNYPAFCAIVISPFNHCDNAICDLMLRQTPQISRRDRILPIAHSAVIQYLSAVQMANCAQANVKSEAPPKSGAFVCYRELKKLASSGKLPYLSDKPGELGGHHKLKIYGKLDCPSANRHISNGDYIRHRVFFADETTAIAAGYRPCGICMKESYNIWTSN